MKKYRFRGPIALMVVMSVVVASCQTVGPRLPPTEQPGSREEAQRLYEELKVARVGVGAFSQGPPAVVAPWPFPLWSYCSDEEMSQLFESDGEMARASYQAGMGWKIISQAFAIPGSILGGFVLFPIIIAALYSEGSVYYPLPEPFAGMTTAAIFCAGASVVSLLGSEVSFGAACEQFNADLRLKLGLTEEPVLPNQGKP